MRVPAGTEMTNKNEGAYLEQFQQPPAPGSPCLTCEYRQDYKQVPSAGLSTYTCKEKRRRVKMQNKMEGARRGRLCFPIMYDCSYLVSCNLCEPVKKD